MTLDVYDDVTRNQLKLTEARSQNGFTKIRGQCFSCSKVCKSLCGLRNHQQACRKKTRGSSHQAKHVPTKGTSGSRAPSTRRRVFVDGGRISDDNDIKPPLQPAPRLASRPTPHVAAASSSATFDMREMNIELQRLRIEVSLMNSKLSAAEEIKDKYIQLLEERQTK